MANPGTRFNKVVAIGVSLASFAALGTSVLLYVNSGIQIRGAVRTEGVPTELTATGSNSTVVTTFRAESKALTATGATATAGANGKYAIGRWQNPKTQTAALLDVCIDVYTAPSPATRVSAFINNEDITGSGSAKYLFKDVLLQRGANCFYTQTTNSGTLVNTLVGPNEHLKISNSLGAGSGQGLVGDLTVYYRTLRQ